MRPSGLSRAQIQSAAVEEGSGDEQRGHLEPRLDIPGRLSTLGVGFTLSNGSGTAFEYRFSF
jgi:hypothetical protein